MILPPSYEVPAAAALLLLGGLVACFFGYRLFRVVLAIFGFILGALMASSFAGAMDTAPMVAAVVVGGLIGSALLFAAYYVGVALAGAGLGVVVGNLVFSATERDPHVLMVVLAAVIGAVGAMILQRYFVIVSTAFGGAWAIVVGALALATERAVSVPGQVDLWGLSPLSPAAQEWVPIAWAGLGVVGMVVQFGWTGGERGRSRRRHRS